MMAAWTPWNAPPSSSRIFPESLPTSSAGVPMTLTVSPTSSATLAAAIPAPRAHGRNHVMTAGMSDARQTIILGADGHVQRAFSRARGEGRRHAADAALDCETGAVQGFGQPGGSLLLLETQLRVGVNPMTHRDQLFARLVARAARFGFCVHETASPTSEFPRPAAWPACRSCAFLYCRCSAESPGGHLRWIPCRCRFRLPRAPSNR